MPVYREQSSRLSRAIESVLRQRFKDLELIVVQDDEADYGPILGADPRIRLEKTGEIGAGPSAARNIGLTVARGKFICFLDSDDFFELDKLETMVPYAEIAGACFDNTRFGYENVAVEPRLYIDSSRATTGRKEFDFFAVIDKPLWAVYRRDLIEGLRFLESIRFSEDSLFNYQAILRKGSAFFCKSHHHNYVIRENSASHGPDSGERAERAYREILLAIDNGAAEHPEVLKPAYERKREINLQYISWVTSAAGSSSNKDYQTYLQERNS